MITVTVRREEEWSDYYVILHDFEAPLYYVENVNKRWEVGEETLKHYGVYYDDRGFSVPRSLFSFTDGLLDRNGYPETCRFWSATGQGFPLTEELQWYWFNLCVLSRYGTVYDTPTWRNLSTLERKALVAEWGTFTDSKRVLTNKAGTDLNANYIANKLLGEPLKGGLPRQSNLAMGGNVVKVKRHTTDTKNGEPFYEIEVWDGRNPVPNALTFNWRTHPHLVHLATNSTPFAYDGKTVYKPAIPPWRVNPFHFFGGRGSPYALLAKEKQWIAASRVRRLRKNELFPRPYVP